jgi:foldase protein PrsA
MKLERFISSRLLRQFLKEKHVETNEAEVDAELERLRKNPPFTVRPVLQQPLEKSLEQNYYTMDEYRQEIWNNQGLKQYVDSQWKKAYPDKAALEALVQQKRAGVKQEYFKTWHILFVHAGQEGEAENNAKATCQRLEKGEDFAKLAKELSKDKSSAKDGGYIGYISQEESPFGADATAALAALKPGGYSQPLASPWGWHIFKRETLSDEDVIAIIKESFVNDKEGEVFAAINKSAKIEYFPPYEKAKH